MLYMIGLGLSYDYVSVRAINRIKKCERVFLEGYTSLFSECSLIEFKEFLENEINNEETKINVEITTREFSENRSSEIIEIAKKTSVAFLVIGDVFSATTHSSIFLEAKKAKVSVEVINNSSIITAVGITGLSLYKFGRITTIVCPRENFFPLSPYEVIQENKKNKLHTLVLLDIYSENNKKKDEMLRLLNINHAIELLFKMEDKIKNNVINNETKAVGCSRLGSKNPIIKYGNLNDLKNQDFGDPPHCLIFPSDMHFMEEEILNLYSI